MLSPAAAVPERDALAQILVPYERGLYLTAHRAMLRHFGPVEGWRTTGARVLGGRILNQLGAGRRGGALHFWAHKRDPQHAEAAYYYLASCVSQRSALRLLHETRRVLRELAHSKAQRAHLLTLEARVLVLFRDHGQADARLDEAERLSPDDAWVKVERASASASSDRLEQALEQAKRALEIRPDFVSAVRQLASVLSQLGRMPEAIETLSSATSRVESGSLEWQCGSMLAQVGRSEEALAFFARAFESMPCLEPGGKRALFAERADAAYRASRFELALTYAREVDTDFYRGFAERLDKDPKSGRIALEVPWVRQKHMTCAPATMASIASHLGVPVDHEALSAEICYGGTRHHGERQWAERNDFVVREFTVTLEATRALIDRGVPFALTTIEPTSGHLQAVHGYDTSRGTLLVRDPSRAYEIEYAAEAWLASQVSTGPRGMAFVPRSEAARLDNLQLPDSGLYDDFHAQSVALEAHDRAEAVRRLEAVAARAEGHRIHLDAKLQLAYYDRDPLAIRDALAALAAKFPDSAALALRYCDALQNLAPLAEREGSLARFAVGKLAHPALVRARADLLAQDGRRTAEAWECARLAVALSPTDPLNVFELAIATWGARDFDRALMLYRFAACLDDTNEHYALSYFRATRLRGVGEEGLAFLEARMARFASQSARPVESLFEAYRMLDRHAEGFAMLETALEGKADGLLQLFASRVHARHGHWQKAQVHLEQAKGKVAEPAWLRAAARLATLEGNASTARELTRRLTVLNPLDLESQEQLAAEISETHGPEAAAAHFASVAEQYPHHYDLASTWLSWARRVGGQAQRAALDALVRIAPHNPWVQRERAFWLLNEKRIDEGMTIAREQLKLMPSSPYTFGLLGQACARSKLRDESMAAYRQALALDPDYLFALDELLEACTDAHERHRELMRYHELLTRNITNGPGLKHFATQARGIIDPARLDAILQAALAQRPDLVETHIALAREHRAHSRLELAQNVLEEACKRFAYRSDVYLELSAVCALRRDPAARLRALERAHEVDPDNSSASVALVEELIARASYKEAIQLCEGALLCDATDAELRLLLAKARYGALDRERAFSDVESLVAMFPGYDRAWSLLDAWDEELGRPETALAAARALVAKRPDEARSWLVLAKRHAQRDDLKELKLAVERATALNPELFEAYDLLAHSYAEAGRWAEALQACSPKALEGRLPCTLKGRYCWVLAQRGSLRDAISGMEEVLRETPDYVTGTRWLCDFYERAGDDEGHARAARRLAPLDPDSAPTHGYVGAALLAVGDRDAAKDHLWRSVAIDPSYGYGSCTLFDLHLEDDELPEAERALSLLIADDEDGIVALTRRIKLRLKQENVDDALSAFAVLLRNEDSDAASTRRAYKDFCEWGFEDRARAELTRGLCDPKAFAGPLEAWVDSAVDDKPLERTREALALHLSPAGIETVASLLTRLVDAKVSKVSLGAFLWRQKKKLLAHTALWGATGYVLVRLKAYRTCARWLSDYASREGAEAWQLFNIAQACWELGRSAQAGDAHRVALGLARDHTASRHRAWAALHAALHRRADEARAHLDAEAGSELSGQDLLARGFAEVALASNVLARQRTYAIIAPLRSSIVSLIERAKVDLDTDAMLRSALKKVVTEVAATRPWWQALWIRFSWRKP